jgi:heme/copper-type cytochrome/quinol oxidase subunit 1
MKPKQLIIELIILTTLYLFVAFGIHFLLGTFLGNATLDISLHDTYLTIPFIWTGFTLFPFLQLTVFIYLVRTVIARFKKQPINIILIISNLSLIISTLNIYKMVLLLEQEATPTGNGWTIYPPLSALPKPQSAPLPSERPHFDHYVLIFIIIFMLILVISSILTGKNWKTNTHEPTAQ